MYEDDVGTGDITTEAVIKPMKIKAMIKAKDDGILAGVFEACSLLEKIGIKVKELIKEGSEIKKGDIIMELEGDARKMMQAERTVLDFLTRLSGIATLTNQMVKEVMTYLLLLDLHHTLLARMLYYLFYRLLKFCLYQ